MPNWCHNRVTAYGNEDKIEEVKKIFESKTPFNDIFPQPDWKNTPNNDGELPVEREYPYPPHFPISGRTDDRWYDWCIQNWDTKWEASEIEFECDDSEILTVTFDTAWSPPEGVIAKLREKFPDVTFSCFYDEPGMEAAGYY